MSAYLRSRSHKREWSKMEFLISNSDRVKLRRFSKNVVVDGLGIIMLGAWTCIKFLLMYRYNEAYREQVVGNIPRNSALERYIFFMLLVILAIVFVLFHFLLGIKAINYGYAKSPKKGYLVMAAFMLLMTLITAVGNITSIVQDIYVFTLDDQKIISAFTDFVLIFILIDLFYSTLKVAKIRKAGSL